MPDFWMHANIHKRIKREEYAKFLDAQSARLREAGATWLRWTRINGETKDDLWCEGWLVRPEQGPPFDASVLTAGTRI